MHEAREQCSAPGKHITLNRNRRGFWTLLTSTATRSYFLCDRTTRIGSEIARLLAFRITSAATVRHTSKPILAKRRLKTVLADIEYCIVVGGTSFTVRKYEGETDYSADVEETFAKFKQGVLTTTKSNFLAPSI